MIKVKIFNEVLACDISPVAMFIFSMFVFCINTICICISSLDLGELGVVGTHPDVAVRLRHMLPPKNYFHPHLYVFKFNILYCSILCFQ